MYQSKKRILIFLIFVMLVLSLTACNDSKNDLDSPKYSTKISLTRKAAWGGAFLDYSVIVDGEKIGTISNNDTASFTLDLTEGKHIIYMKKWFTKSKKLEFNVSENNTLFSYICKTKSSWGISLSKDTNKNY